MKSNTKTTTPKKKGNESLFYLGIALAIGGAAFAMNSKKKQASPVEEIDTTQNNNNPVSTTPKSLDYNLVLKQGSRGQEVLKLQSMMGINADGVFGPQTESKLYALKRVRSVSLNGFSKIATALPLTKVIFPTGTKVMSKNRNGAKVYLAERKADGTYFSTGKVSKTFYLGEHIGIIRAASADGQAHSVVFKSFWDGDFLYDDAIGFVNTVDIEKYT